jgi:hypothetical protein
VLPFSCSCLVSSSPTEVEQFKFECCALVQEMIPVIHYLPCFGGGFLLCLFIGVSALGAYFFALPPFSGAGSVFHQPPLLSVCYAVCCLLFSFGGQFDFGCCSLAQEMSSVICYLPYFGEWLIVHLLSAFLPFQCLFTDSSR